MQCAHQPVPITLQRGTGKALAGKLQKTVQLFKTSNLKCQEAAIISSVCLWKNGPVARATLQSDACLEAVQPPLWRASVTAARVLHILDPFSGQREGSGRPFQPCDPHLCITHSPDMCYASLFFPGRESLFPTAEGL